jgi:predicted aspartyl protease
VEASAAPALFLAIIVLVIAFIIVASLNKEEAEVPIELLILGLAGGLAAFKKSNDALVRGQQGSTDNQPEPVQRSAPSPRPQQAPRTSTGSGVVTIKQDRDRRRFLAKCMIAADGGQFTGAPFQGVIDTGANVCVISHAVARQLGITDPKRQLRADGHATIGGGRRVPIARATVDWNVEGLIVRDVETDIFHEEHGPTHNLIGMSFLSQVRMKLGDNGDEILLAPKRSR